MSDTPEEPAASDPELDAGSGVEAEEGAPGTEPQTPPPPSKEAVSQPPPADPPPKAESPKDAAAPPKKGITIGSLAKPPGGGPRAVITRVGVILVAVLVLATLAIGGATVISKLGKHTAKGNLGTPASPTPSPTGETYFTYSNDQFQFSIDRPNDWTTRVLNTPDPKVALVLGPPSPFPQNDIMVIRFVPLSGGIYGTSALGPFKDTIVQNLGPDVNMVSQNPGSIAGLPGWNFTWDTPKNQPKTFYDGWYLLDGVRFVELLFQIQPPTDSASENALVPIFEHMVKSFVSYAPIPQPTETATPATTGTATPKASPSGSG